MNNNSFLYKKWLIFSIIFMLMSMCLFSSGSYAETAKLTGKVIILDPGHGGPDGGAVSKQGLIEKNITLPIAKYLRSFYQEAGATVILTREKDQDLANRGTKRLNRRKKEDLANRIQLIKQVKPQIVISIHLNAFPRRSAKGAQAFYHPANPENKKLSIAIQKELLRHIKNARSNPSEKKNVYLLKYSTAPTTLIEVGYLSNRFESNLLSQPIYQKQLAACIYYGSLAYFKSKK
ncbi:N-acetylmuramoyl-L-alanine amidase [Seinonella peptonophila]|uniref:N-acetylmuramoyl-L-alanine amidase n=1 Tax=Seinonella peptonophila TaxID=112248 RepID=A0A1M4X408_9BACL|nr:N-acetylmuramoyl-L-alanine amidase [Seinonella peptonophila]SHE88199.1 N-acetylmuramoyl-L-alanine amidase [Seinonella peptonophila]